MSAYMGEAEIPSQHIRKEVCATRPAYREGKNAKAVKVFTINQESRYLLFQGVPAMGTTQELIKLCAINGAVEEYRLLDEFPSADQFTDVVLVKFKRIQSARHAKKKLDDWSFFGSVLHVSYAPEYENLEETREKLQDRRKAIAARLRILGKGTSKKGPETQEKTKKPAEKPNTSNHVTQRIESRIPSLPDTVHHTFTHNSHNASSQYGSHNNNRIGVDTSNFAQAQFSGHAHNSAISSDQNPMNKIINFSNEQQMQNLEQPSNSRYQGYNEPSQHTFMIPPPPMREPFPNYSRLNRHKQNYNFARVPTANAPYPPDFDARTDLVRNSHDERNSNSKETFSVEPPHSPKEISVLSVNSKDQNETQIKDLDSIKNTIKIHEPHQKLQNLNHPKYQKITEQTVGQSEKIIIKEFKKSGSTPKFIPRQMLSATKLKSVPVQTSRTNDELDKQLRKNAVVLGSKQGPAEVPEEYKKPEKLPTEKAVETTVTEIRKRVSEFSSGQSVKKKAKID